jgi:carboxylesterase type B
LFCFLCRAGFLSTGDSNAPGNYAILDLVAALHWIKENIGSFSGDSNSVTLLGHGYGASLVNLLLVSPVTRGENAETFFVTNSGHKSTRRMR